MSDAVARCFDRFRRMPADSSVVAATGVTGVTEVTIPAIRPDSAASSVTSQSAGCHAVEAVRDSGGNQGVTWNTAESPTVPDACHVVTPVTSHTDQHVAVTAVRWDGADWLDRFNERAAIAEYDAKMTREKAELAAHLYCRVEWYERNPPPDPGPDRCCHCHGEIDGDCRTVSTDRWRRVLHTGCDRDFGIERKRQAETAMAEVGIPLPESSLVQLEQEHDECA